MGLAQIWRDIAVELSTVGGVKPKQSSFEGSSEAAQALLERVQVGLVTEPEQRRRFQQLLRKHHYLGGLRAVGEQMYYGREFLRDDLSRRELWLGDYLQNHTGWRPNNAAQL